MSKACKIEWSARQRFTVVVTAACGLRLRAGTFTLICALLAFAPLITVRPLLGQSSQIGAGVLLESGIEKEDVDGDLKSAMDIYQRIATDNAAPREVRARALLRLAGCDEKLGHQSKQVYEQIVREFADQPAAAQARKRLALITQQERPAPPATMSERKIEWSRLGLLGPADTDGERAIYSSAENLYFGDLAGRNKHLILSTKNYDSVPCRDFSLVTLDLLPTPTRQHTLAVIKTDGTGYRTLIRDDAKNSIFQQNQPFAMSCSWDDRNVLLSNFALTSAISGELWAVSVADGQRRVIADVKGGRIRKAVFSPDGRFAAYEVWPRDSTSVNTSRIFIVPVEGGEPRLAYESAPWHAGDAFLALMDWTADGRYLILRDVRQGKSALYLLPMKDGAANGAASFVRFGEFDDGYTTEAGSLVYEDKGALPSNVDASLASIGPDDHLGEWRSLDLSTNGATNPWPSFSPDGTQIAYIARNADPTRRDVILRDLATGQERAIYQSSYGSIGCRFSVQSPKVFCTIEKEKGETDLISVAFESGAVENLATFPGSRFLLAATRDDQAFYFSGNAWLLGVYDPPITRWDRTTKQETIVESAAEDRGQLSVSADSRFIAKVLDGVVSIRPTTGGDWKPLASGVTLRIPPFVMPDGKWVLYQTADANGKTGLFRVPTVGGSPERLGDLPINGSAGSFFFSPDGHQILAMAEKQADYGLSVLENFVPSVKK
jgi:Tol biopolymer transport system component